MLHHRTACAVTLLAPALYHLTWLTITLLRPALISESILPSLSNPIPLGHPASLPVPPGLLPSLAQLPADPSAPSEAPGVPVPPVPALLAAAGSAVDPAMVGPTTEVLSFKCAPTIMASSVLLSNGTAATVGGCMPPRSEGSPYFLLPLVSGLNLCLPLAFALM